MIVAGTLLSDGPEPSATGHVAPAALVAGSEASAANGDLETLRHSDVEPSTGPAQAAPAVLGQKRKVQFADHPAKMARIADEDSPSAAAASQAGPSVAPTLPNGTDGSSHFAGTACGHGAHPSTSQAQPDEWSQNTHLHDQAQPSSQDPLPNGSGNSHTGPHSPGNAAEQAADPGASGSGGDIGPRPAHGNMENAADDERASMAHQVCFLHAICKQALGRLQAICVLCILDADCHCHLADFATHLNAALSLPARCSLLSQADEHCLLHSAQCSSKESAISQRHFSPSFLDPIGKHAQPPISMLHKGHVFF